MVVNQTSVKRGTLENKSRIHEKFQNLLLDNWWMKEKIKKENSKIPWDKWLWKYNIRKHMVCCKAVLWGIIITINTYMKKIKITNKHPFIVPKEIEKKQQQKWNLKLA